MAQPLRDVEIFVEEVQESILSVEACKNALEYLFDKNKIWCFNTKIDLKMLLEGVTKIQFQPSQALQLQVQVTKIRGTFDVSSQARFGVEGAVC